MQLPKTHTFRNLKALVVVTVFVAVGASLVMYIQASPFSVSSEAESGTQSPNAAITDDLAASGGHAVKFANPSTPPPSPMDPPTGAKLIKDLSRRANWETEDGATVDEIAENGPGGEVVIRNTLVDGQTGATSGVPSERSDLQGGTVPMESTRWMIWYERFVELPTTNLDRWQVVGPNEIHGETLDQATVMPEVSPAKTRRLNANAGRPETRYFDIAAIKLGEWHQMKFGVHYTQAGNGWLELWRDGVRVIRSDGATTTENRDGYWKFGNYRNADINGRTVYDISGCRVYDGGTQ